MPAAKKTPVAVRKDPKLRPVGSGSPYFDLVDRDPEKKYVWVYKAAVEMGVDYYRDALGYEPSQTVTGGVRPRVGKADRKHGDYIESMGHILMELSKERAEEIDQYGIDGNSGQAHADVIEKHMHNSKKAIAEMSKRIAFTSPHGSEYFAMEAERGSVAIAGDLE